MPFQIVPYILRCLSGNDVTKENVLRCIGIICTNAIGVNRDGKRGRVLYEIAALASHNCQMNAVHSIDSTDFR